MLLSFNLTVWAPLIDEEVDALHLPDPSREGIIQAFMERRITIRQAIKIMDVHGFSSSVKKQTTELLAEAFSNIVTELAQKSRAEKERELYLSLVTPPANATVFYVSGQSAKAAENKQ